MLWTTPFFCGQPLIETWVTHGQPYPYWISEYLENLYLPQEYGEPIDGMYQVILGSSTNVSGTQ
jgi:hypothetical protein